jgi:AAA+ ATPase superfamily predicted ATPase
MSETPMLIKIRILLEGEIIEINPKQVNTWFTEVFAWVEKNEKYILAARLRDAKQRWEKMLNAHKSQKNYEQKRRVPEKS